MRNSWMESPSSKGRKPIWGSYRDNGFRVKGFEGLGCQGFREVPGLGFRASNSERTLSGAYNWAVNTITHGI